MASSIVRVPIQTEISFIGKVWIKPPLLTTPRTAVTEHFDSPEGNWNSFRHRLLRIAHSSLPPCLPIFRDFAIYRRHLKILNRRDLKLAAKKKIHSAHVVELFGVRLAPRFFALASVFFEPLRLYPTANSTNVNFRRLRSTRKNARREIRL